MAYNARNYDHLLGMEGFSDALLKNHFTLYQGYVTSTNKLGETLEGLVREGKTGPEYAELRRRYGWEWNGMRLHEYYFDNLGGKGEAGPKFLAAVSKAWGSHENWKKEFLAVGAMRGVGWVVTYYDAQAGTYANTWVGEHDVGHLAGATPIVVMDVFEHAFMLDYGLKRADYLNAFYKNVNWGKVEERIR